MGVSVSASTAIIVAGLFFAFTAFYPVAANGFERVTDAQHEMNERALEQKNTDLTVTNATYENGDTGTLIIDAINDGSVGIVVSDTTLVVGNEYIDLGGESAVTTVDDNAETDLWLGGEELTVTVDSAGVEIDDDTRVVLVVESGVRDSAAVVEVSG